MGRALSQSEVRRKHFPQGEEVERLSSNGDSLCRNLKARSTPNGENLKFKMKQILGSTGMWNSGYKRSIFFNEMNELNLHSIKCIHLRSKEFQQMYTCAMYTLIKI